MTSADVEATTPPSRRDPRRRKALLDAADRMIQREGPEVSMAAIAAEAGISKPILYRHFGDKSGLYRALAERHADPVIEVIRAELRGSGDLPERVRPTIDAYLATISANHNLYRFLMHRAQAEDERTRGQMSHVVRKLGEEVAQLLFAAGTAADPARAQVLGHAVVGMVQAAGDWWLDHPEVPRATVVDGLVQIVVATLAAGDPALRH